MLNGTVHKIEKGYEMRFVSLLQHGVEPVWAAITEPEILALWLAKAEIERVEGGKFELRFENTDEVIQGKVKRIDSPYLFEHTWNEGAEETIVRWELQPKDEGCQLILTHTFPTREHLAEMLAGWHTHLELLASVLEGQRVEWSWSRWEELRDSYNKGLDETTN